MKDTPATYHYLMAELPDGNKTIDDSMAWTLRTKARAAEGMIRAVQAAGTHATAGV